MQKKARQVTCSKVYDFTQGCHFKLLTRTEVKRWHNGMKQLEIQCNIGSLNEETGCSIPGVEFKGCVVIV